MTGYEWLVLAVGRSPSFSARTDLMPGTVFPSGHEHHFEPGPIWSVEHRLHAEPCCHQRIGDLITLAETQCRIRCQDRAILRKNHGSAEGNKLAADAGYF